MSTPAAKHEIGYILRSYPRLSQTFVLHEILALESLGLALRLFAITNPHEPMTQPQVAEVRAPLQYLEAVTSRPGRARAAEHLQTAIESPRRYLATLRYVLRNAAIDRGYTASSRWECFHQAVFLTRQLRRSDNRIGHLHAHFAHDPTLIALLTHMLTGISFSFTAHARDLVQIPRTALVERIAAASAMITCCGANMAYLDEVAPAALRDKVRLIYHGVNLQGFQPAAAQPGADGESAPLIVSVGRLVEKKGFPDLIRACALLKQAGQRFRCAIYGDGPLRAELSELIAELGLAGQVSLPGELPQHELIGILQASDVFALAPFVTEDGDRDGVPNVLVEAMACGLPVVSTAVAGIPELVRHEHNGLLAAPHDHAGLAAQLSRLLGDRALRMQLAAAARQTVVEQFDLHVAARQIAELFAQATRAETRAQLRPHTV
jgi:glycosyltransferase involved in cell wall biosynthesis